MTMARYSGVVQDQAGNIITNAKIEVRREVPGQPLAALKSDRAGATAISNPFDAETDGTFFFHVVSGAYQVRAYTGPSGSPTMEDLRRYVPIGLLAESDATTARVPLIVTAAGDVTIGASDGVDDYYIEKTVGAATNVYLPSAESRTTPLRIIDGKGDASANNITIIPESGETIFAIADYHHIIDGNGGQITLTPRPDGAGWV